MAVGFSSLLPDSPLLYAWRFYAQQKQEPPWHKGAFTSYISLFLRWKILIITEVSNPKLFVLNDKAWPWLETKSRLTQVNKYRLRVNVHF